MSCPLFEVRIETLADYITVMSMSGTLWFRGHEDAKWRLAPSALRYDRDDQRKVALGLLSEFRRVAEIKLSRPPLWDEDLKWVQLAQHYGVPTPLLDWTESPTVALYFACRQPQTDGMVFVLNPIDLNRISFPKKPRIFDVNLDSDVILKYLTLHWSERRKRRLKTVAINPVWNSERIVVQKGAFTLHGTYADLDNIQAPSLVAVPILREAKPALQRQLERIGVDEMTMFPEL